jgi:photosystem II stability/assembly factor-like uncharacterized protein
MVSNGTILVGTVGQGVFRSADGGGTWGRISVGQGMHSDCITRCLATHPTDPAVVFAGTDLGIYRSDDAGASWRLLDTPMSGRAVWAIAIDGSDANIMLAGTGTPDLPGLYRSADGGETWEKSAADLAETCPAVGVPRPTALVMDPTNHASIWAGLEVDGVRHSSDGGRTWDRAALDIANQDVHNLLVTSGPDKRIFVLVNDDVWISNDAGESFQPVGVKQVFPWHYPRGVASRPDQPNVVFVTIGDTTPGRTGAIMRSDDAGRSWQSLPLPGQPNSAMWTLTIPRSAPDLMFAASRYGHLYRSDDGGDSWSKLWREFSEVSSLAYIPS